MTDNHHESIFISYRGVDQIWAVELLYARLTAAFGADAVFKAGNTIRPGEQFPTLLRRQAAACPVMLVCIGPGWLDAEAPGGGRALDGSEDWVRREIAIALAAGNDVIPVLCGNHDQVGIPPGDRLPENIRGLVQRQGFRLAPGAGLDATVPKLLDRLAELVPELAERRAAAEKARERAAHGVPPGTRDVYRQEAVARDQGTVVAVQNGNVIHLPAENGGTGL